MNGIGMFIKSWKKVIELHASLLLEQGSNGK